MISSEDDTLSLNYEQCRIVVEAQIHHEPFTSKEAAPTEVTEEREEIIAAPAPISELSQSYSCPDTEFIVEADFHREEREEIIADPIPISELSQSSSCHHSEFIVEADFHQEDENCNFARISSIQPISNPPMRNVEIIHEERFSFRDSFICRREIESRPCSTPAAKKKANIVANVPTENVQPSVKETASDPDRSTLTSPLPRTTQSAPADSEEVKKIRKLRKLKARYRPQLQKEFTYPHMFDELPVDIQIGWIELMNSLAQRPPYLKRKSRSPSPKGS